MAEQTTGASDGGAPTGESEDTVLSMVDVLQESEELEEEATAVLGDSDDKCCTYPLGYRGRQALYSCATCTGETDMAAGICLACSYECHEGHQLYELYTKRNFRCDCGNSKFGSIRCKLIQNKDAVNADNKYNQNFRGLYCICSRPYPDPEDQVEDEMIQCVACEDWFHGRHLGGVSVPDCNDYQEMVCSQCMQQRCAFLWYYSVTGKEVKLEREETPAGVDVEGVTVATAGTSSDQLKQESETKAGTTEGAETVSHDSAIDSAEAASASALGHASPIPPGSPEPTPTAAPGQPAPTSSLKTPAPDREETSEPAPVTEPEPEGKVATGKPGSSVQAAKEEDEEDEEEEGEGSGHRGEGDQGPRCCLAALRSRALEEKAQATFWPNGWRSKLCTCQDCKRLYESRGVGFLMVEADTVLAYELRGKVKQAGSSQYQMGMEALTRLNRVQQVEVLHEYNDLKASLRDYLQSFASQGKVVKRQDIDEFFSDMQTRKRQRLATGNPQYFCR